MKKKLLTAFLFGVFTVCLILLAACGGGGNQGENPNGNNPTPPPVNDGKVAVIWYDATGTTDVSQMSKLKEERVEKGTTLTAYTPEKEGGYEFMKWYATPTKSVEFDFTKIINEDTSVFAGFTKQQEDTRDFYIVGSGTSQLMFTSDWGKATSDEHKLTKTEGKNEYTITLDLMKDDVFQFAIDKDWHNQRGFGYLPVTKLEDGTAAFSGEGSPYSDSAKKTNIKVETAGNYTLTLTTYPGDDYYDTKDPYYTEATKESYNMGTYDTITWVRNGDVLETDVTVKNFYIKGQYITAWGDLFNNSTRMTKDGDIYSISVWLKANDQIMFHTGVTKITTADDGTKTKKTTSAAPYIKNINLTDESLEYVEKQGGSNIKTKADGRYDFTYDSASEEVKRLSVKYTACEATAMDYYLDGNIGANGAWNEFVKSPENYKLIEGTGRNAGKFTITKQLEAGQTIQIRACAAGETPTTDNTAGNLYQFDYTNKPGAAFEMVSFTDNNIKVVTAGYYDITIDGYSKIITFKKNTNSPDTLDIYLVGQGINNWEHNFSALYKFKLSADQKSYEFTFTVGAVAMQFGIRVYPKGSTEGDGEYHAYDDIGTAGDANSKFTKIESFGADFGCTTAGKYKIVYTIETGKIDFYNA